MQAITTHLWFDKEAKEAAALYTSIFKDSKIKNTATLHNSPSGTVDLLTIELLGQEFKLINAGPLFKSSSSLRLYRFSSPATRKRKSRHCGMSLQEGARHSSNSENIRSVRNMDGHRTDTAFRGR